MLRFLIPLALLIFLVLEYAAGVSGF